jgi:acyl transferase domain-containing protein
MVLLKTLAQAIKDEDHIYAVIKAIAVNNDGRTAGPATPNPEAQKEVMQTALGKSGKKPGEISYIEVNGSGSQVTDLLELKAIQSIYRSSNRVSCGLGSMKPNIGHPLCAEGIAGFIKVVLMLQHRQWVPFLSGEQPLKHYDMESSPFYFCRKLTEWTNAPRVAAINCFADGGTNAHVIIEAREGPSLPPGKRHPLPPPQLYRYDVRLSNGHPQPSTNGNNIWKQKIMEE